MNTKIKLIIIIILTITILSSCQQEPVVLSDKTFALDTLIDIKIYLDDDSTIEQSIIDDCFSLIRNLENTLSVHIEGSDVYNIKENAGIQPTVVSDITYDVIKSSIYYSHSTNGLFDITSGPLIDLWAIDPPNGYVPTDEELAQVLDLVDYNKIQLADNNEIYLLDENMIINLGAIAKGSIADEVKSYLVNNGVTSAYINLGGNVQLIGNKPSGEDFAIGIQNPFDERGAYIMSVSANDSAVVSSGDYERYFEYEGQIYHHILNTKTGYPADTNIKQITIIAPNSQMADALSTSVLLLGIEDGLELINFIEDTEAVFITKDKKIYITDAVYDSITFVDGEMSDFTVVKNPEELYD